MSSAVPKFLTRRELSEHTGKSLKTLANWAAAGKGPRPYYLGAAHPVYLEKDVLAWLRENGVPA